MSPDVSLRRAVWLDIETIMAIERRPGFEDFVARSTFAEHEAMLASHQYLYFVGAVETGVAVAFAILRDLEDPHGNLYLKRIAVREPGLGVGVAFLRGLVDWVFRDTKAHRFWLSCFSSNLRARRAYEKLGFTQEGLLREAYLAPDGGRLDLTMMALLRTKWDSQASSRLDASSGRPHP
jgi:RimJ/RimL family protein N-acetyltransferase